MNARVISLISGAVVLSACVAPLEEYRPVVDPSASSPAKYERDLEQCYAVAKQAEADYQQRQQEQLGANIMVGILVGALTGAAIGDSSDWAATGAVVGGVAGAAETDTELAVGGPRRIIDRCMTARGHVILSDLGRG